MKYCRPSLTPLSAVATLAATLATTACTSPPPPTDVLRSDAVADRATSPDVLPDADVPPDVSDVVSVDSGPDASMEDVAMEASIDCPIGLRACGEACIDQSSNVLHCGGCDQRCTLGQICEEGACVSPCTAGQRRCAGACTDSTSDRMNCGGCGIACGTRERCEMSSCVPDCPAGQSVCSDMCVSLATDSANCGRCGSACAAGQRCTGGMCESICAASQQFCSGSCVNPQSDSRHCGMCDNACPAGQMCSMGMCTTTCTAPTVNCSGTCVNTTNTPTHCGACGRTCASAPNASAACAASSCTIACNANFGNCDGNAANGCETSIASNLSHCGACGRACVAGPNQSPTCSAGSCVLRCNAGFGDCDGNAANGCETNLSASIAHCGACGASCSPPLGGAVSCVAATCSPTCGAPSTFCGPAPGRCANLQSDLVHCGACGNACAAGQSCISGTCMSACSGGQIRCGAVCVDINTSAANCGACGRTCAPGESCQLGACLSNFAIGSLSTSACLSSNIEISGGDQRGGIALSASNVFVMGDASATRTPNSTITPSARVASVHDGLVSDLGAGQSYVLGTATGPLQPYQNVSVDRLFRLDYDGAWNPSNPIMLSAPIAIVGAMGTTQNAIYNGSGRVVIHSGTQITEILLPSGNVVNRGTRPQPTRSYTENWATWGVAEIDAGALQLVYVASSTTISRLRVTDGAILTVAAFTNLSDAASFVVSPSLGRWFVHFEGTSQFGSGDESLTSCPMTFDSAAGNYRITSLSAVGCNNIEVNTVTGDDRGGMGLHYSRVVLNGDSATMLIPAAATLTLASATQAGTYGDHLFTDLRTSTLYGLFANGLPVVSYSSAATVVNQIRPLNEFNLQPTGAGVMLSPPITVTTNSGSNANMIFNGWGRLVLFTNSRLYSIEISTGRVSDLGAFAAPTHSNNESWAAYGVAETQGTQTNLVYIQSPTAIVRQPITGTPSVIASFTGMAGGYTGLGDSGSLIYSPLRSRWYIQAEYQNQLVPLGPIAEWLISCAGTHSN